MKCTDRTFQKRRRKRQLQIRLAIFLILIVCVILVFGLFFSSNKIVDKYEAKTYSNSVYHSSLFAQDLCVTKEEVVYEDFYRNDEFKGALLFNVDTQEVLYSEHANERLYPASTTKLMTAYLCLKYGDLEEYVSVSEEAINVPSDSSTAQLEAGDTLTLEDLLYSLMLASGNDSANAIAEHISGSIEEFVKLMNNEAKSIGASNTHFENPHGYHDDNHYTTAYDLYLMFNECLKFETFVDIISSKSHDAVITKKDGTSKEETWTQTNQFLNGARSVPDGVSIIGGKTGNTNAAGSCLVQLGQDSTGTSYISIIMGATSMRNLYDNMTFLWMTLSD